MSCSINFRYQHGLNLIECQQVRLTLEEPEPGVTVVKLTHTDIPEEDRWVFVNLISMMLVLAACVDFFVFV